MIFKTWITDLTKIQGVVNSIKSIELWANGATVLLNPNVVNNLSSAINGLNLQQAQLALSTRNLTQEQMHQVLVQAGLIASEDKIQAELVQSALAQSSLSAEKQKAILMDLDLMNKRTLEIYTTKACTKEELLNMLATKGVTGANADAIISTLGLAGANNTATLSFELLLKAIWGTVSALLANPFTWVIAGIVGIATVVHKTTKAIDETKESAKELGHTFNDTKSDIESYKSKIEELHKTINDSNSSVEDVTNARQTLMSVQDELIDKFGTEKTVISDVTNAINGQTEALDRLTMAKWQEIKNEYNSGGFWENTANFLQGTDKIDRMLDEYGEKSISLRWLDYADTYLSDQMVAKLENIGVDIVVNADNLQAIRDFDSLTESINNTTGASIVFTGNAEEIYNKLLAVQNLISNDDSLDELYDKIEFMANSYKDLTDNYKNFYNQYILYEKILNDGSGYADTFKDITDAAEKYNEAFISGNEEEIKKASDEYASILSTAMAIAIENGDLDVATYFENMYPTLKSIVDSWKFNVDFDLNTNDLQAKVQYALEGGFKNKNGNDRTLTAEEILGLDETSERYQALVAIAHDYNMSIEEMIELLKERNLVSTMDYQQLVGLFGQENIEKLSPEDLEIAYTIENVGSMTFDEVQTEIQKTKESVDEINSSITPTISSSVEQISRQLEPQFAKLGDVYASIFSDDGFNLDVVDNSMLESLRKSFAEIEEEIGITFDADKIEEFFDVISDGSHTAEETQQAFDDLATAYFYSTDTLEHLNEETAESIKQQLQQMGIVNSEEIINHYLSLAEAESGLIEIQNQLADAQKDLAESSNTGEYESAKGRIDLIYKQIEAYYNEKGATEELRLALFNLQLQQADLNINSINSSSSVAALLRLAEAAGLSAEYIDRLAFLQDLFNQYNTATNGDMQSAIYSKIQSVKAEIERGLESPQLDLEVDFPNGTDSGAGAAGKDAAQEYLEGFNNECDRLKFLRDNSIITEKEYLDQLRILYEQYFKDKEDYLEEYVKYEREYLNGLKSLYENVLGGITDLLDKQMDKSEEERDAKIEALETEQEARTKALEQQKEQLDLQIEEIESQIEIKDAAIDAINDEIDAIKKANDERQRQLDLQKALYDLERMQNQRTILQYSEDKGMHYVNDTSGIRDAKQAVDDAKTEIEIADKEKQISLIEDEISLLETRKTLIEDQQADLDNQMNALDEFYQKLTENTESYYLALIAPMEQYKAQFESIAEIESGAVFDEQLNSLGYSANDILALSSSTLENFKSNYLGILGDIYAGNTQMLDSLSMVSGLNGENLVGYLSQSQPYIDSLARLDLSSTQSAIDSANNGIYSFADGAVLATTNITTMADTTTALLEGDKKHAGIISSFETMASVLTDANNQIAGITSGMEELDGKTATIKINIETNGDTSLLGKAYSSGTAIAGSSHLEGSAFVSGNWAVQSNEQNSLVGEEGFEIIVRNGKFFTVGNNGAELANIQKGDIVFNHEQSKNLLKYGHISGRGKAYADGTVGSGKILTSGGLVLRPLQPGAQMYDLVQKFDAYIKSIDGNLKQLVPGSFYKHNRQMNEMVNHMTNSSVVNNRNIHPVINNEISVTLPNVTNSTSAETLMKDLQSLGTKKFQVNW